MKIRRLPDKLSLREKFDLNYTKTDTCWNWIGSTSGTGYGQLRHRRVSHSAHRLAYVFFVGNIPCGMVIDHICHNKSCINPSHLRCVTQAQNMQNQKINKGNKLRGVGFDKFRNKWRAYLKTNGKTISKRFETQDEANKFIINLRRLKFPYSTI